MKNNKLDNPAEEKPTKEENIPTASVPKEIGGRNGHEPIVGTEWVINGRCIDF